MRQLCEALVCLAVAVILFRTFQAEGYMISTGSMAPALLGFHKQVTCPECRFCFAYGISVDDGADIAVADSRMSDSREGGAVRAASRDQAHVVCPNCGLASIDVAGVPLNQGDQLLVNKNAWLFHPPRRWEVVVFRNPHQPTQAYVKRIVGLPGETVEIRDGDLYIDGKLASKGLHSQRAVRVLVYDYDYHPADELREASRTLPASGAPGPHEPDHDEGEWRRRWIPLSGEAGWKTEGTAFVLDDLQHTAARSADIPGGHRPIQPGDGALHPGGRGRPLSGGSASQTAWVEYRHWIRGGGTHESSVKVPDELRTVSLDAGSLFPTRYDERVGELHCTGALPAAARDRILAGLADPRLKRLIQDLYETSHEAPVNDEYGYNPWVNGSQPQAVRDLMFAAEVTIHRGAGRFRVRMTDGRETFELAIDAGTREVTLFASSRHAPRGAADGADAHGMAKDRGKADGTRSVPAPILDAPALHAVRRAQLRANVLRRTMLIEMSLFDRQVIAAIDGQPLFAPVEMNHRPAEAAPPRRPVRFGAVGLRVSVASLKLYRDVYYTEKGGSSRPCRLGPDEYYVLGDNSPVSADSRVWNDSGVPRQYFLGKPFLVHLPSRPGRIRLGKTEMRIRIPDLSRIRYIR